MHADKELVAFGGSACHPAHWRLTRAREQPRRGGQEKGFLRSSSHGGLNIQGEMTEFCLTWVNCWHYLANTLWGLSQLVLSCWLMQLSSLIYCWFWGKVVGRVD